MAEQFFEYYQIGRTYFAATPLARIISIIVLAVLFGWCSRGFLAGRKHKTLSKALASVKDELRLALAQTDALQAEQTQLIEDSTVLRTESIAENDSLKYELEAARDELEQSKNELMVLSDKLPKTQASNAQMLAMRDALAVAQADLNKLSHELETKTAEAAKLKTKADTAIANAVNISTANMPENTGTEMAGWRARFFESRTRLLEAQLRDQEHKNTVDTPPKTSVDSSLAEPQNDAIQAHTPASETDLASAQDRIDTTNDDRPHLNTPQTETDSPDTSSSEHEEELASLRWRVRYLETRLANFDTDLLPDNTPLEDMSQTDGRRINNTLTTGESHARPIERLAASVSKPPTHTPPTPPADLEPRKPNPSETVDFREESILILSGIGLLTAKALSNHGIITVNQMAALAPEELLWLEQEIGLGGRPFAEDWVGQAKTYLSSQNISDS